MNRARLRRAMLIERLRSAEYRRAAADAQAAQAVRDKLEGLSERTRTLAGLYSLRDTARDGADLAAATMLSAHLREIGRAARAQADTARAEAEVRFAELARAERRRQRSSEDRRDMAALLLAEQERREAGVPIRSIATAEPEAGTLLD
ncbi:hypothetical protein [Croceibacterium ferulae]|uniref:hypothetical protein n=1 Tax=Croceibacterium ferulae TaxID=1854641 RepID=UPI000F86D527|nr:hypothetical protein [Croceibacterium ferulae]